MTEFNFATRIIAAEQIRFRCANVSRIFKPMEPAMNAVVLSSNRLNPLM